ncbi:tripartite tricarboxylate transporter TctB family protein [Acuticoccus mangrovi]|uniref:Tripartite tricarboxylate transporter TctB family protein n=1 Tax=Acuticoccus mangrovi TaxID=2796142 RepID=A0A934MF53_9HYPH|nr:tripartite tricarboxylate transporter TctB family protein [Acuticoccus mangrovi]MBJ3774565.1 tripartite tricarboxylate transporter TctB family protein [Acuticoccus mangrovi]
MTYGKDRIAAVILFAVAAGVFLYAGTLPFKSMIFPRMITAVMAIGAVMMFLRTVSIAGRTPQAADDPKLHQPFFRNPLNFVITVAAMLLYLFTISQLGYFTATLLVIVLLSLALGFRDYRTLGLTTIAFLALVYVIFILIFDRPLPQGLIY